jgi:hypothetical protein
MEYGEGRTAWHALHGEVRKAFKGSITKLREAERSGQVLKHKERLSFVAQRYYSCRPINPAHTQSGWYDVEPLNSITTELVGFIDPCDACVEADCRRYHRFIPVLPTMIRRTHLVYSSTILAPPDNPVVYGLYLCK